VDQTALRQEIERLRPRLEAVGQDAEALIAEMITTAPPADQPNCPGRMLFRFLGRPPACLPMPTDGCAAWKSKKWPRAQKRRCFCTWDGDLVESLWIVWFLRW